MKNTFFAILALAYSFNSMASLNPNLSTMPSRSILTTEKLQRSDAAGLIELSTGKMICVNSQGAEQGIQAPVCTSDQLTEMNGIAALADHSNQQAFLGYAVVGYFAVCTAAQLVTDTMLSHDGGTDVSKAFVKNLDKALAPLPDGVKESVAVGSVALSFTICAPVGIGAAGLVMLWNGLTSPEPSAKNNTH